MRSFKHILYLQRDSAEKIGFHTIGGKLSFPTLVKKMYLPCIIYWEQNHFVVIYKIKKRKKGNYTVYIADPARGLITYNRGDFLEHWANFTDDKEEKGIALLLEPTELFYNEKETRTLIISSRASLFLPLLSFIGQQSFSACL